MLLKIRWWCATNQGLSEEESEGLCNATKKNMKLVPSRLQLLFVLVTITLFLVTLVANAWLFKWSEHIPGVAWVYLPAGVRMLCTLLFAGAGAAGLVIVSVGVSLFYFFPDDPQRALVGGLIGGLAPYCVYLYARHVWGLQATLGNLSSARLLSLSVAYAVANSLLHNIYFVWRGQPDVLESFVAMGVGDLMGTLIVLYSIKAVLARLPQRA